MKLTYAYIETTSYCNLKCIFCNREDVIEGLTHMSLHDFEHILTQIKDQPIAEAKLMGMGEPFMHPQFDVICKRFKETFPACNVISATNAQLKFNSTFKDAVTNLDVCYISIDGNKENYERIRLGSKWEKLLNFLEQLKEFKSSVKCQFPINYTICPDNVYDIAAMFELKDKYNLDDVRLNFVQNWSEQESDTQLNGFTQEQIAYLKQYKKYFKGKSEWNYSDCFWPRSGLYLTAHGKMKVCCMNTSAEPIGSALTQPIRLLRSSKRFNNIKRGCETNLPTQHCDKCSYKELVPFLKMIHED